MGPSFGVRRSPAPDTRAAVLGGLTPNAPAAYGNAAVQQAVRGEEIDGLGPAIRSSLEGAPPVASVPSPRGTLARAARDLGAHAFVGDEKEADADASIARSAGAPLDSASVNRFGAALGCDLSQVRVHTDSAAAEAAEALHAHAFALGADVFFAAGAYAPGTAAGDELLAHELAHVQQHAEGRLPATGGGASSPGDAVERDAEATAREVARGLPSAGEASPPAGSEPRATRASAPILRATDAHAEDEDEEEAADTEAAEKTPSLDDIMGDGMAIEIDVLVAQVDATVSAVRTAFATLPSGAYTDYAWHADGAEGLADALLLAVGDLIASASQDEDDALTWDDACYLKVSDLMDRCEAAVGVLGHVRTLATAPTLIAYAQLFAQIAAVGLTTLSAALIEGETAFMQLQMLVDAFQQHHELMKKYAIKGLLDAVDLGLPKVAERCKLAAKFKDLYGWYKIVNAWTSAPDPNPWSYAKKAKTMSWPIVKDQLSQAGGSFKDSVPWIDLVWNLVKVTVDATAEAKEVALLQNLLDLATEVQAKSKASLELYLGYQAESQAVLTLLTALEGSEQAMKDLLDATEASISAAMTGWGDALYEVG